MPLKHPLFLLISTDPHQRRRQHCGHPSDRQEVPVKSATSRLGLYVVLFGLAILLDRPAVASADPVQITSGHPSVGGPERLDDPVRSVLGSIGYDLFIDGFRFSGYDAEGNRQN